MVLQKQHLYQNASLLMPEKLLDTDSLYVLCAACSTSTNGRADKFTPTAEEVIFVLCSYSASVMSVSYKLLVYVKFNILTKLFLTFRRIEYINIPYLLSKHPGVCIKKHCIF